MGPCSESIGIPGVFLAICMTNSNMWQKLLEMLLFGLKYVLQGIPYSFLSFFGLFCDFSKLLSLSSQGISGEFMGIRKIKSVNVWSLLFLGGTPEKPPIFPTTLFERNSYALE